MKKIIFLICTITCLAIKAHSQDTWLSFEMGIGGQFPNYKELNSQLDSLNFPRATSGLVTGSFGLSIGKDVYVLDLEGTFLSTSKEHSIDNISLKIQGMNGKISIGYKFSIGDGFFVYPKIGICGGTHNFIYSERVESNMPFLYALDSTRNQITVSNYYLNATLGGEFLFPMDEFAHISLKFGFGLPTFKNEWSNGNSKLTNIPDSNPCVFFLGMNFVFYINERHWYR